MEYSTKLMWLVWVSEAGEYFYQPWEDVEIVGGLIDPETDEDLQLVGWTTVPPKK